MKKISLVFAVLSGFSTVLAQDPLFFNANQALVNLNPSFAGTNGFIRNQTSYRSQWPNVRGNMVTYLNSFDAYIKPLKAGIAVSISSDDQAHGTLKTTNASLAYAQHLSFRNGDLKIIPSVQAAYGQKSLDRDNLHFGDMIDLRYNRRWLDPSNIPKPTISYLDLSSGLLVNYKNLYIGASVFHFNRPDAGLNGSFKLPALYSMNLSYNKVLSENILMNFSGRVIAQQEKTLAQAGATMYYKKLLIGLGYRSQSATYISAGVRTNNFTFLAAYDRSFSEVMNTASSWEVMVSFNFRKETPKGFTTNPENW